MPDLRTHAWRKVNNHMEDEFREIVVDCALNQLPKITGNLQQFARSELLRLTKIPGYRSAYHARSQPLILRPHIVKFMQHRNGICTLVISLWALEQQSVVEEIQTKANQVGFYLKPDWSWQDAKDGFYEFEDIPLFSRFVDLLGEDRPKPEADHLKLACLWLSRGIDTQPQVSFDDLERLVRETIIQPDMTFNGDSADAENDEKSTKPVDVEVDNKKIAASAAGGQDPVSEKPTIGTVFSDGDTITQIAEKLEKMAGEVDQLKNRALKDAETLPELVEVSDFLAVKAKIEDFRTTFGDWENAHQAVSGNLENVHGRLAQELKTRPGLNFGETLSNSTAVDVLDMLNQMIEYDREKTEITEQIEAVRAQWIITQAEIDVWLSEKTAEIEAFALDEETVHLSLAELQKLLDEASASLNDGRTRLSQLRQASISRIKPLIQTAAEYGIDEKEKIFEQLTFRQLQAKSVGEFSSRQLVLLEETIEQRVEILSSKKIAPSNETAQQIRNEWSSEQFIKLLNHLASEKKDVEIPLLLISAGAANIENRRVELSTEAVISLLQGLGKFSKQSSPFRLLNLLSPRILSFAQINEPVGQTIFCLAMLGASVDKEFRLPEGILWQLGIMDLPVAALQSWNHLWQIALTDEALPEILAEDHLLAVENALNAARTNLDQAFKFEGGVFVRLHSLQSRRHKILLGNTLMPEFQNLLEPIQKMEVQVAQYPQSLQKNLTKLEEKIEHLNKTLTEDAIRERYQAGVYQHNIHDSSAFLTRSSLRILNETAESIQEYATCLRDYWRQKTQFHSGMTQQILLSELEAAPQVKPVGLLVLDQLRRSNQETPSERDTQAADDLASDIIIRQILQDVTYITRLPTLVGFLVNNKFEWSSLYEPIVTDLANVQRTSDAAEILIRCKAPNQVLLLASNLPLDPQKQAQELKSKKEKETLAIQTKLLQITDTPPTFERDLSLGRWGLIQQELSHLLSEYETRRAREQAAKQEIAKNIRREVFETREAIYDNESLIPALAKDYALTGLNEVQKVTGDLELLEKQQEALRSYLDEINYRLSSKAWNVEKSREALEHLRSRINESTALDQTTLTASELLKIFEEGNLQLLGLVKDQIPPSSVDTRWHILHNWIEVSRLPSFYSKELNFGQRATISALFRYVARMTKLQQVRERRLKDGPHLAYEEPVVYSYWELQYPKTDALKKDCVLVSLPGSPPAPSHLRQLEDFIEENQWLDDYTMVFLFAPGCRPAHRKRLSSNKSLVIIDEQALLKMILAEAEQRKPIGYLRSMMLNALGAENVDIFKVNQLVNPRTSIFVGRDYLIKRVAGSDGNYVLYGGRRIGKSSVLMEIGNLLEQRGTSVVFQSFEGEKDYSDDAISARLMRKLKIGIEINSVGEFKEKLQEYLDEDENRKIIFLLDEIDRYIEQNPDRHILIEAMRALSDRNGSRLRVVVAGFMALHNCLEGGGPYTPTSDPWRRMFNNDGPLPNLPPTSAENIVQEGFLEILGWQFERRSVPQLIVRRTGGHPAFVQSFCDKLQRRVANRGDRCIRISDINAVFENNHPEHSFIAYVRHTLKMNLDPIEHYIILYLAQEYKNADGFTRDQAIEITRLCKASIPSEELDRSLQRLEITSVVKKRSAEVFEFTVPDFPFILSRLGETKHLNELEKEIERAYPV